MNERGARRILMMMPSFPAPESGAEQSDRAEGIRQLRRLGYEVSVIAKVTSHADHTLIKKTANEWGIQLALVPYKYSNRILTTHEKIWKFLGKFKNPLYLDGAAYEYADPEMSRVLGHTLDTFKPDIVWFEYSYLWPLYKAVRRRKIPIITRSANFEPQHFLEEKGRTFLSYIKVVPKYISERLMLRWSTIIFAITPREKRIYERMGGKDVRVLPLRGLSRLVELPRHQIRDQVPLHVFFMGASYSVEHNKAAARMFVHDIAPEIEKRSPGAFIFHVFGAKLPEDLQRLCDGVRIVYEGYIEKERFDTVLQSMDIALVPSLMGAGMQQKVFEPLTRGFPVITSRRAIAEYPFRAGEEYIPAHRPEEFVAGLRALTDHSKRCALSLAAHTRAQSVFSQSILDTMVNNAIHAACQSIR